MKIFNNYSALIETPLRCNYTYVNFLSIHKRQEPNVVLRHDIDFSPYLALEMAKIESNLGIKATYFFMLRSPFYNLFSRANNEVVKEIIALGHEIGLHYDEGYYPKSSNLQTLIDEEIRVLENNFGITIDAVSFHQPSQQVIDNKISIKQINTYDRLFFKDIKYISDSNMIFKEDPIILIQQGKFQKIQLLIHPIWWTASGETPEEKFISTIKLNFEHEQQQIITTERAYGAKKTIKLEKSVCKD
jgi:hypothetical protein